RVAPDRIDGGSGDRERVEAGVRPEGLVLDGGRRVDQGRGDLVELQRRAMLTAVECGQHRLPVAGVDDRIADRVDLVGHVRGVVEILAVIGKDADTGYEEDDGGRGERPEDDQGDQDEWRTAPPPWTL